LQRHNKNQTISSVPITKYKQVHYSVSASKEAEKDFGLFFCAC